ncbi:MAG: metal-dependent hydrolase [Nanopusillaceae archaeon]|jgi:L-ascorbate metabolism protein UlaG (beta-lactamase superfamily)
MVDIKWIGHACFLIKGSYGNILIDPFIYENPVAKYNKEDLEDIDLILITHGHSDHIGNAIEIAEKNNATIIGIYELTRYLGKFGVKTIGMNFGGRYIHNNIEIYLFPAIHSSGFIDDQDNIIYLGEPGSFVIKIDDRIIYHAGDTMVFEDMKLIPKIVGNIDLALLPIGGHFTMDVEQALIAIEYLKPKKVIPMHYNTWNMIKANPYELKEKAKDTEVIILEPSGEIEI